MRKSFFCGSFLLLSILTSLQATCLAQKDNDYWNNINKNYPNLNKPWRVPVEVQKPGEIQKPTKPIQVPGDIQIPRGIKAIKQNSSDCNQRFTVGADTLFEFDKATLTPFAVETLSALKPMIEKLGAHPIKVEGHTDGKGSDDYNQSLSERRAERVKNWLCENHVAVLAAVQTEGFGKRRPVASNTNPNGSDNPQGRAQNRRVEIVVDTCKTLDESKPEGSSPTNGSSSDSTTKESSTPSN
jgi:outer membrane protein OmpA-like peptidoglycan-associated protein